MFYEENINALTEYFASGCKKEQLFGVELEHFVISKETRETLPYENGVERVLQRLQPVYGEAVLSQGRIIGITREGTAEITLEPAGQLEISIHPTACLKEIRAVYDEFIALITLILDEINCELFCAGYHPKSTADDMPLIPKKRYELMDEYFKKAGTCGKQMMRGTAATQINIDYESEADFCKKYRVANVLGPVFSFMYDSKMLRAHIWNNVDPARAPIPPGALDRDYRFRDYAKYIYDMPPIFILRENKVVYTANKPNHEIFANQILTYEDIEHITSMAFPDVRLKNRVEIRMADSMPIDETLEFTRLIGSIFYNGEILNEMYEKTKNITNRDIAEARTNLLLLQEARKPFDVNNINLLIARAYPAVLGKTA